MVDEKFIEDFHALWDNYPGCVRLITSKRMVIAINEIAASRGYIVGKPCSQQGDPKSHGGFCKLNEAIQAKQTVERTGADGKIRYWIPVKGHDDLFVHVTVG